MSNFAYTLFDKVFVNQDASEFMTCSLPDDFSYKGKSFSYIKNNYKSYNLDELKEILYLYRITMNFADHKDKHTMVPVFIHKDRVETVIEFINDRLDQEFEESESESDEEELNVKST